MKTGRAVVYGAGFRHADEVVDERYGVRGVRQRWVVVRAG
jgi:hypothetical protein